MLTADGVRTETLGEHRASRAWRAVHPGGAGPTQIETLQGSGDKAQAYRLAGVGPMGMAVVAKRCRRAAGLVEQTVYEAVLPRLGCPTLAYHGFVEEPDGRHCWLFVEDAGQLPYRPSVEAHRVRAGQWLAELHTVGAGLGLAARLPNRGPRSYLEDVRRVREMTARGLANPALVADERAMLERLLDRYDRLEAGWGLAEALCEGVPPTVVHADLCVENLRVRSGHDSAEFLVFDWEMAGWGPPTVDLIQGTRQSASPDLDAYWSIARQSWPAIDLDHLRALAELGKIFRSLQVISWHIWSVEYDYRYEHEHVWLKDAMKTIRLYLARIVDTAEALDWSG